MATTTDSLVKQIKQFFEEEMSRKKTPSAQFSDEVVQLAQQKMTEGFKNLLEEETDPMVLAEVLKGYLETDKLISERGIARETLLLKLFEQMNKYEQSRYY